MSLHRPPRIEKDSDENFLVVDDLRPKKDLLSICCLIDKKETSKEALAVFLRLAFFRPLGLKSPKKQYAFKCDNYGLNWHYRLEEAYSSYLVFFSQEQPSAKGLADAGKTEDSQAGLLKRIIQSGWSQSPVDLNLIKDQIKYEYAQLSLDPVFSIRHVTGLNFLLEVPLGRYPYGDLKKIEGLNQLALEQAQKKLIDSPKMACYLGNTDYQPVLAFRRSVHPASKIFPLERPELKIGAVRHLEESSSFPLDYLSLVYKTSKVLSEQGEVFSLIEQELLLSDGGLIQKELEPLGVEIVGSDFFKGEGIEAIYLVSLNPLDKEFEAKIEATIEKCRQGDCQAEFQLAKEKLAEKYMGGHLSLEDLAEGAFYGRLRGISLLGSTLLPLIENCSYEDFKKYLKAEDILLSLANRGRGK